MNHGGTKTIRAEWQERYFAEIPETIGHEQFNHVVQLFRNFCALPDVIKKTILIGGEENRGKNSFGYIERTPTNDEIEKRFGKEPEHKLYFHYHPIVDEKLKNQLEGAGPAAHALVDALHDIWIHMEERAYETVLRLEEENRDNQHYESLTRHFFPDGITQGKLGVRHPKMTLRLMMYHKVRPGMLSANNHYDAGMLAFAICESTKGLQVGTTAVLDSEGNTVEPEHLSEVDRPDGTALLWPGATFKTIDPGIMGTWHGVKQHTTDNIAVGKENRSVLVCFLDVYDGVIPSLEETHGLA